MSASNSGAEANADVAGFPLRGLIEEAASAAGGTSTSVSQRVSYVLMLHV